MDKEELSNAELNQRKFFDKIDENPCSKPAIGIRLYETFSDDNDTTFDPFSTFRGTLHLKYADP